MPLQRRRYALAGTVCVIQSVNSLGNYKKVQLSTGFSSDSDVFSSIAIQQDLGAAGSGQTDRGRTDAGAY